MKGLNRRLNRTVIGLGLMVLVWLYLSTVNQYRGDFNAGFWGFLLLLKTKILFILPAFVVGSVLHEMAHAYVAFLGGDPTGMMQGRISFDPRRHMDPMGTMFILVANFGWAKPVPINRSRLKNPQRDFILAAAAGPLANFLVAAGSILFVRLAFPNLTPNALSGASWVTSNTIEFFQWMAVINAFLGVFNLFPVHPLDGSRFLEITLSPKQLYWYNQNQSMITMIFIAALLMGVLDPIFLGINALVFGAMFSTMI